MDRKVEKKVYEKLNETLSKSSEINSLVEDLHQLCSNKRNFVCGIVIGRIYNSFYYQTRRILGRNPTDTEFKEFMTILNENQQRILTALLC